MRVAATKSQMVANRGPTRRFPPPGDDALRLSIPRVIPEPALNHTTAGGRLKRLSDATHYHVDMDGAFTGSRYEVCSLGDGFLLTSGEICFSEPESKFASFPDTLRVYVASGGDGESVFSDGCALSLKAPSSAVIVEPANCPDSNVTATGRIKYVCVFLRRDALMRLYGGREDELPTLLQAFVNGGLQSAVARPIPLSSSLLRCLLDVHGCHLLGQRRWLYMHSKAVEIVCHALDAFESEKGPASLEATKLTASNVLKAQQLLTESFVNPPSLRDLAREVGMSRTSLCTGFRQVLGQSVFDYIEDLRMQRALTLLKEDASSVTAIAHAVGYNHSSSFSVAILRRFGATPSELRRKNGVHPLQPADDQVRA